jgi:hypothetical protein
MGSNFARYKGHSTNGTIGRFHPVDSREAICTDSPVPLFQEFFTADALGRQQKLEESFGKDTHSKPNCAILPLRCGRIEVAAGSESLWLGEG